MKSLRDISKVKRGGSYKKKVQNTKRNRVFSSKLGFFALNLNMSQRGLPRTQKRHYICHIWMGLLPMFLIACSGSLGKVQLENLNAVIVQSEAAIDSARLANAQALAPETLQRAEHTLASAKEAVSLKDGLEAIHLAYNALAQAQIAEQEAMYKSQESGLNAIIKRKEADIAALQANLKTADEALEKSQTDIQQLDTQRRQLETEMDQKLRAAEKAHQEVLHDYNKAKTEGADLQLKLDTTQTQLLQAQSRVEKHERQIGQLRRELADVQLMVKEARKKADEARKETAEVRTKAAAQARSYSRQIERLDQSNVLQQRKDTLAQKRLEAKAYVQQQGKEQSVRTSSTSLTSEQIANGRAVISDWALAWAAKDIPQHLSEYTQDAALDQIIIRASNEEQAHFNRMQMGDALQKMAAAQWQETGAEFDADGESVIGTYRFRRLSQEAMRGNVPARHDLWTREVWARQVGTQWKIFRETWRIYEAVPRYGTTFN